MKNTLHSNIALSSAYRYFNKQLFGQNLPDSAVELSFHSSKTKSIHRLLKMASRENPSKEEQAFRFKGGHRIELSSHLFFQYDLPKALSYMVREMVTIWQLVYGNPSRKGYYNSQWAQQMELNGLIPSHNSKPGGKKTGQQIDHYIEQGGQYILSYHLMDDRIKDSLLQMTLPVPDSKVVRIQKSKIKNKIKYSCPSCNTNIWGKPTLYVICGPCNIQLIPISD